MHLPIFWLAIAFVVNAVASSELLRKTQQNHHFCDEINPDLPDECTCLEPGHHSLLVKCVKVFDSPYLNDTIGIQMDLEPCDPTGSKLSLDITEENHHIDFPITNIQAGETENIPIPGLSIIVPTLGHVGIDASVYIAGNPDQLTLKVGLNACAVVKGHKSICASSIPGLNRILPYYFLHGTYSFGKACATKTRPTESNIPARYTRSYNSVDGEGTLTRQK